MNKILISNDGFSRIIQCEQALSLVCLSDNDNELKIHSKNEFSIHFNGQIFQSSEFKVIGIEDKDDNILIRHSHKDMDVVCVYKTADDKPYLKKWLEVTFHKSGVLEKVIVESFKLPTDSEHKVAKSNGNLDICLFLNYKNLGLFFTLDHPYNDITINKDFFDISYPPFQNIRKGEKVVSHVSTIGSYHILGNKQGKYDLGEAEAFRSYLLLDYAKPHFQSSQLVYSSIVNQYTEVNFNVPDTPKGKMPIKNKIFYTLTNAPYLMLYPERIPDEIDFCKSLSMDFCQIYEGPFEWIDEIPSEETLLNISNYAKERGIKLGLYTGANNLTAPHFNHYGESRGKAEWLMVDIDGNKTGTYCFGSDAFTKWFTDVIIQVSQKYGFLMTNFDFLVIAPCYAKDHNHSPGGIYQQITNVWKCLKEIRSAVPDYVFDSNLGWDLIVPKIACQMDGFYLTDPYVNTYFPSLNATKILDDSRRADMIKYFKDYLTPVEYFRNCEYYVCANSVISDFAIFEYGILQGLALTPNLQLGEARALFDRLNSKQCEHVKNFLAKWTKFVKDNWGYYQHTKILSDLPHIGQVEIYAHCKDNKGYVFLVNPNPFRLSAKFNLDETIGLSSGEFLIKELYPEENMLPAIGNLPFKKYGETIEYPVEAQKCSVLSIEPAPYYNDAMLFGLPAVLTRTNDGYFASVSYFQGREKQVYLQLPKDEEVKAVYSDDEELNFHKVSGLYTFSLSFPKEKVEPEIRQWVICKGSLDFGLQHNFHQGIDKCPITIEPSLPNFFLGAYIENLLNEKYPISLKISARKTERIDLDQKEDDIIVDTNHISDNQKYSIKNYSGEFWLSSRFEVPFIQKYIPPDYHHHNFIMLNFSDPEKIKYIKAWINGQETFVDRYSYWRGNPNSFTYYLDGTNSSLSSGKNTLALWISCFEI